MQTHYDPNSYDQLTSMLMTTYKTFSELQNDPEIVRYFAGIAFAIAIMGKHVGLNICKLEEAPFASQSEKESQIRRFNEAYLDTMIRVHLQWVGEVHADQTRSPESELYNSNMTKLNCALVWKGFLLTQLGDHQTLGPAEQFAMKCLRILSTVDGKQVAAWVKEFIKGSTPTEKRLLDGADERDWPPPTFLKIYFQHHEKVNEPYVMKDHPKEPPLGSEARPLIGGDLDALIDFAAWHAARAISDQRQEYEEENPRKNPSDAAMRFAVDDFLVGYAVGRATRNIQINGRDIKEVSMEVLLANIQKRLNADYPGLEVAKIYRTNSAQIACGILLGLREPSRNTDYSAMKMVWGLIDEHQLTPGTFLNKYAYETFGVSIEEGTLVQQAGDAMHRRYMQKLYANGLSAAAPGWIETIVNWLRRIRQFNRL